jgi:hypothetical protein
MKNILRLLLLITISIINIYSYAADCNGVPCPNTVTGKGIGVDVNSNLTSRSDSSNAGVNQYTINQGAGGLKYSGGYTVETVPGVSAPALTTTLTDT